MQRYFFFPCMCVILFLHCLFLIPESATMKMYVYTLPLVAGLSLATSQLLAHIHCEDGNPMASLPSTHLPELSRHLTQEMCVDKRVFICLQV